MNYLIKNAKVYTGGSLCDTDIRIENGLISAIAPSLSANEGESVLDYDGKYVFPGFTDVHVHLREPGFSYKETIKTGTLAAAHGGYTAVCSMPNLKPVPDSLENLKVQQDIIEKDAAVRVYPYASITCGEAGEELSDMEALAPYVAGFSDDGKGVQSDDMMRRAMERARELNKPIVAHCEDESLLNKGWSVHEGEFSKEHGLVGNPSISEWYQVERDIDLIRETGAKYHVCHVSTKESVALIRLAKAEGLDITCETGPHYLTLCDTMIRDEGRFRMNPPIRSAEDQNALIEGICDGTVDMIATDHAPHSAEEKSGTLDKSLNGIVGLECAFPILYTKLVRENIMPLSKLILLMSTAPNRRFNLSGGEIKLGAPADITVFDLNKEYEIKSSDFLSMGRATPFEGERVYGKCLMTMVGGKIAWIDEGGKNE
jgi:dihydroorotase